MKRTAIAVLVAALIVPTVASARKRSNQGYIVFWGPGCENVAATDLDVEITGPPLPNIVWTVVTHRCNVIGTPPKVTVGIFESGGEYYSDLLDCTPTELQTGKRVECTIKCKPAGGQGKFAYAVCVKGEVLFDPEIRLKGVPLEILGACTTSADKTAVKQKCMADSQ
jgi:hypothetical protein